MSNFLEKRRIKKGLESTGQMEENKDEFSGRYNS